MSNQTGLFHRAQGTGASYWGPGDLYTFLVTGAESDGAYFSMLAVGDWTQSSCLAATSRGGVR